MIAGSSAEQDDIEQNCVKDIIRPGGTENGEQHLNFKLPAGLVNVVI